MVSEGVLVKNFSSVFCSPQSGIFSCQCLDLGKIQTSPSGTPLKSQTIAHMFQSSLPLPGENQRSGFLFICLFVFNYACRSGWGVYGEWVPQISLLATIRLVSHSPGGTGAS